MTSQVTLPEILRFGRGVRHELATLLPPGAVLILCGKHSRARVEGELLPRLDGREVEIIPDFPPEPPLDRVDAAVAAGRRIKAASVIGWGGGSAIDGAKAVAALLNWEGSCADAFYGRSAPEERTCFFAAVPTTAGTGAEVTANAVLTDPKTGIKQSLRCPGMTANAVLSDPELVEEAPLSVLAGSGMDALTQSVESFLSRKADTLSRELARSAGTMLWNALRAIAAGTCDASGFDRLTQGSLLAGCALSKSGLGAVHGVGHPAGSRGHIPHGVCCAILLPTVLEWNRAVPAAEAALSEFALALTGDKDAGRFIAGIRDLRKSLSLPEDFRAWNFTAEDVTFVVDHCRSGSMKSNPRDLSDEEVRQLMESLC